MIKIKAHIKLYANGRKNPFTNNYRPLFNFTKSTKTSGQIELIDREKMYPGECLDVIIVFLSKEYLGENFIEGRRFTFDEGGDPLGEGVIITIISLE